MQSWMQSACRTFLHDQIIARMSKGALPKGIASLPLFHQVRGQKILLLGEGEAAEPKRRLIERVGAEVIPDMQQAIDEGVRIAFVAYDDAKACEVAAINLRCAGLLVNVVDRPELCDFTTPSILDRDPLLIAIGTGGASAGLAKHIRLRLERILPQTLGKLARALQAIRPQLRERLPNGAERRQVIDKALGEGGILDPLAAGAHKKVKPWFDGSTPQMDPVLEEIALTSSDPEELTLRAARLLGLADRIVLEGAVPEEILARARADAERLKMSEWDASQQAPGLTVTVKTPSELSD